ncbi:MAG: protein kinase domain-containing protein, partial [Pyrinomonadaceae bacterium]
MTLTAGTRLGRYEIRSQLGAGGMGEVYLARDVQLDRVIALKILPASVASDQQRFHRFLQEARAASALSHPNAAHIYEIGEAVVEGATVVGGSRDVYGKADTFHFIAMEFVDGQPLDRKISGAPLRTGEILDIAVQIADALDEAHAKAITHRDIKSSNIMITPRGRVKVLDFGLAKITTPGSAGEIAFVSELATRVKTSPGLVMGTVNYMSPEQALGRDVDHRSDIFSFGVVLYEMATGRLPFAGENATEIIDRIAHTQPEAIARLNYDIPPELEVIIKKTLRKDRDERYQTIHDLLVDLRDLRRELDISDRLEQSASPGRSTTASGATPLSTATTVKEPSATSAGTAPHPTSSAEYIVSEIKRHKTGVVILVTVIVLAIGLLGIGLSYRFGGSSNGSVVIQPSGPAVSPNMKIMRLTSSGKALQAAISPDGKWVVYELNEGGKQSLWIRQIATSSNIQIVPPSEVRFFRETFSPDGTYVYYQATDQNNRSGALYQVPSLGGPSRKIISNIAGPITFSPDGSRIAFL